MKKKGVPRCCYKLDSATLPPDIFILAKQLDQVQNNIFVFKSQRSVYKMSKDEREGVPSFDDVYLLCKKRLNGK